MVDAAAAQQSVTSIPPAKPAMVQPPSVATGLQSIGAQYAPQLQAIQKNIGNIQQSEKEQLAAVPKVTQPDAQFKFTPKDMSDFFSLLMVVGALGGKKTNEPMTAALNNMTGVMQGVMQGNQMEFNRQYTQFKENLGAAQQKYKDYIEARKSIIDEAKGDLAVQNEQLHQLNLEYGMDMKMAQLEQMNLKTQAEVTNMYNRSQIAMKELELKLDAAKQQGDAAHQAVDKGAVGMVKEGAPRSQVVGGWGKNSATKWDQYRKEAVKEMADEMHISEEEAGKELARRQVDYLANKRSETQLVTMLGATRTAVSQLEYNVQQAEKAMDELPSSDISPIVNAIARGDQKWTGDPAYYRLFYYMSATATEAARIMSGGQASIAQLHEGAREEAKEWMNTNMTPKSFKEGVAPAILSEGQNRIKNYEEAIRKQREGTYGMPEPAAAQSPAVPHESQTATPPPPPGFNPL